MFAGALAYADDIVLLAPTKSGLTRMLSVASTCADGLSLKFNGTKSQYLRYCAGRDTYARSSVHFCGVDVPRSSEGLHLGNLLGADSRRNSIRSSIADLHSRTNVLLSRFSFCTPDVRYRLFKTHCVIAYGSQLWDFQSSFVNDYFTCWRKCVRRVWGLSNLTHRHLLPGVCLDKDIEKQLLCRTINFIRSAITSNNSLFRLSGNLAVRGSSSAVSNTIARLSGEFHFDRHKLVVSTIGFVCDPSACDKTSAIREFAIAHHSASAEDRRHFQDILLFLCTS